MAFSPPPGYNVLTLLPISLHPPVLDYNYRFLIWISRDMDPLLVILLEISTSSLLSSFYQPSIGAPPRNIILLRHISTGSFASGPSAVRPSVRVIGLSAAEWANHRSKRNHRAPLIYVARACPSITEQNSARTPQKSDPSPRVSF